MKMIITPTAQYGPYNNVEVLETKYVCDGVELQFSVLGQANIVDYVYEAPLPVFDREAWKIQRDIKVSNIKVTVDDMVFDGDETSQNRMTRAITALVAANVPSTMWTLADNTSVEVTVEQLQKALVAAGLAQTAIWAAPEGE